MKKTITIKCGARADLSKNQIDVLYEKNKL
jgi:hypothetical protein